MQTVHLRLHSAETPLIDIIDDSTLIIHNDNTKYKLIHQASTVLIRIDPSSDGDGVQTIIEFIY